MKAKGRKSGGDSPHLQTGDLLDYFEGRGGNRLRARVEGHLAGPCRECRDKLNRLAHLLDVAGEAGRLPEPPGYLVKQAQDLFGAEDREPLGERVRSLLARLLFDSAHDPTPALVRRVAPGVRRLRYELGENTMELEIEQEGRGNLTIRGALIGLEPDSAELVIRVEDDIHHLVPEPSGHLVITGIPDRPMEIEVLWAGKRFRLPPLE